MALSVPQKQALQAEIDELRRQSSKQCLVLEGSDVIFLGQETTFQVFQRLAWHNWGLQIFRYDIWISHPLRNGAIIAKFLQRDDGSAFQQMLANPKGFGVLHVTAKLHLVSKWDKKLNRFAKEIERNGDIEVPRFSPISGKLEFYLNGQVKVVSDPSDLIPLMSPLTRARFKDGGKWGEETTLSQEYEYDGTHWVLWRTDVQLKYNEDDGWHICIIDFSELLCASLV